MFKSHATNIDEPPMEAAKLMVYFEKHRLLEVCRHLMLELGMKRPVDVKTFIKQHLKKISEQVNTTYAFLLAPSIFDQEALSHFMHKTFNIPTIVYKKERQGCDGEKILKKLKKFLKANHLDQKNIIFVNFPSNRNDCLQFRKEHINPTYVYEIKPTFQVPFKTQQMLEEDHNASVERMKQVKEFYEDAYRVIHFGTKIDHGVNHRFNQGVSCLQSIKEIGFNIVRTLRATETKQAELDVGKFVPRVVIIGRKGSGRRTQAKAVANLFGVVYIDVERLIFENITAETPLSEALRAVAKHHEYSEAAVSSIVYKRLLDVDCMKHGWVLVGYPCDVNGFKRMDTFIVPPNKIVFLHCRERLALRRLGKRWEKHLPLQMTTSKKHDDECDEETERNEIRKRLEKLALQELKYFNENKRSILDYLASKKETIHIDGNHSRKTVTTNICSCIEQQRNEFAIHKQPPCAKSAQTK